MSNLNKFDLEFHKAFSLSDKLICYCSNIASICNKSDNTNNPFFIDEDASEESDLPLIYYAKEGPNIVGFISTYLIDEDNLEICGFVLPEYRQHHIFSQLLDKLAKDYEGYYIQLPTAVNNTVTQEIAVKLNFNYTSTEHGMKINKEQHGTFKKQNSSVDLDFKVESAQDMIIFTALLENKKVGICKISAFDTTVCIHDVEISKAYRQKGYGCQLVLFVLDYVFENYDTAILHVTKENIAACRLYEKIGFETTEKVTYYNKYN